MSHKDILALLFPLELSGAHQGDQQVEGGQLDAAGASASALLMEGFPCCAYRLLERWERTYGVPVSPDDPLQLRQSRVLHKMRELGRLDREYFIQLAAAYGYTVWIDELAPFMSGWGCCGDELGDDGSDWCWRVWVTDTTGYLFRAGVSAAGECLSYDYRDLLGELLEELKPAHTFVELVQA